MINRGVGLNSQLHHHPHNNRWEILSRRVPLNEGIRFASSPLLLMLISQTRMDGRNGQHWQADRTMKWNAGDRVLKWGRRRWTESEGGSGNKNKTASQFRLKRETVLIVCIFIIAHNTIVVSKPPERRTGILSIAVYYPPTHSDVMDQEDEVDGGKVLGFDSGGKGLK